VVRAIPLMIQEVAKLKKYSKKQLTRIVNKFDNSENISKSLNSISHHFKQDE